MANILIIAEKPAAAQKIAFALGKTKIERKGKVRYFVSESNSDKLIVVSAVGHLFTLAPKNKTEFPIFDLEWKPIWLVSKKSSFAKQYADLIESLAKEADKFILACDYDVEGEVIGLNVLRFLCHRSDAQRMRFSTLTPIDLRSAYENVLPTLDWGQADAGETRHYLDWLWGINLSRAIMRALESAKKRSILSIGRVQGPALAILVNRELEIRHFVPKPFWQISISLKTKPPIEALHHKNVFWDECEAKAIYEKVANKPAKVSSINVAEQEIQPPTPFDLTTLQTEAWRCFKFSPSKTQQLAQDLYTEALISYPRTSSQKLPPSINYKRILTALSRQKVYCEAVSELLTQSNLKPRQGSKTDPAHPAIYPTGEKPAKLDSQHEALYDLIVRRFLACFGKPAKKEVVKIIFDVNGEDFHYSGTSITEEGWRVFYKPYLETEKKKIPALKVSDILEQKTNLLSKKTEPPKRFSPATIIKELEKRGLGTKATRAQIIDTLYKRGYIKGHSSIEVTALGLKLTEVLKMHAPDILSEALTRRFEKDMEEVRERRKKKEDVFYEAKNTLIRLLNQINLHQKEIGDGLLLALEQTKKEDIFAPCPKCKKGNLRIIVSKKTKKKFLACDKYPECKTTWPLPQHGMLKILKEKHSCGIPFIQIISKGKKPWTFCPNPECKSNQNNNQTNQS